MRFKKRGGRKAMVRPGGASHHEKPDNTAIKALARGFRWKRMIVSGAFATIAELAAHEKINPSYLTRVLRLTLLAPDIVEAILDGALPRDGGASRLTQFFLFRQTQSIWLPSQFRKLEKHVWRQFFPEKKVRRSLLRK
jgi:hypothetical protein